MRPRTTLKVAVSTLTVVALVGLTAVEPRMGVGQAQVSVPAYPGAPRFQPPALPPGQHSENYPGCAPSVATRAQRELQAIFSSLPGPAKGSYYDPADPRFRATDTQIQAILRRSQDEYYTCFGVQPSGQAAPIGQAPSTTTQHPDSQRYGEGPDWWSRFRQPGPTNPSSEGSSAPRK